MRRLLSCTPCLIHRQNYLTYWCDIYRHLYHLPSLLYGKFLAKKKKKIVVEVNLRSHESCPCFHKQRFPIFLQYFLKKFPPPFSLVTGLLNLLLSCMPPARWKNFHPSCPFQTILHQHYHHHVPFSEQNLAVLSLEFPYLKCYSGPEMWPLHTPSGYKNATGHRFSWTGTLESCVVSVAVFPCELLEASRCDTATYVKETFQNDIQKDVSASGLEPLTIALKDELTFTSLFRALSFWHTGLYIHHMLCMSVG